MGGSGRGAPGGPAAGLRVLLVDNYDSFTHNLAHLCARLTGELPEVVRNDAVTVAQVAARRPDAIILSPGPGTPDRPADVGVCPALVRELVDTPLLGVCLGHQVIAAALGARVTAAPSPMHGRLARVRHDGRGLFAGLPDPLRVVRYHSLAVDPASLPPGLRATAWSEDGVLMALAHEARPVAGVQFHPESILTEGGAALLARFLELAASHKSAPRPRPRAAPPVAAAAGPSRARVLCREVPYVDPERAFVARLADAPYAFWLDGNQRFSYLGEAGREQVRVEGARLVRQGAGGRDVREGDPFALVDALLLQRSIEPDPRWPFSAGYVGWLGYELKQFCEGGEGPRRPGGPPDALLLLADRTLCLDHHERRARLVALLHEGQDAAAARAWLDEEAEALAAAPPPPAPISEGPPGPPLRFRLDLDPARYREAVATIHALLAAGDTYEICLTTRARARLDVGPPLDPLALHRLLRRSNPAPYSSYLRWPGGAVVSASPERFLRLGADGAIESRPIKGTRRRGASAEEDARLRAELAGSEKDRAENLMIVDLVRHDLGRVCAAGTVRVPRLMEVEAHPAVHQLVSTVEGRLRPGVRPMEAVRALFPGGSMTGAPKIRAMRIIGELEGGPRGVYSGGIGALGFDGAIDLAMAIRTAVLDGDELSFGLGGAVVALSDADDELEEALLKGRALARAASLATGRPLAEDDPFCQPQDRSVGQVLRRVGVGVCVGVGEDSSSVETATQRLPNADANADDIAPI